MISFLSSEHGKGARGFIRGKDSLQMNLFEDEGDDRG